MGFLTRLLRQKVCSVESVRNWEEASFFGLGLSFFRSLSKRSSQELVPNGREMASGSALSSLSLSSRERTVAVFWDLDNKPPKRVPPFEAATRLREMAGEFGKVVDVVAYANHHAFSHVPNWVQEERKQRKVLDLLETRGEVKPEQPYVCGVCGAKKKTRVDLTKHFKMLHEREQKKRVTRLDSLKAKKKKERFWSNNGEKMAKYTDAARSIIIPPVGYGLMQDIKRAGVYVRTVKDEPQAADVALKSHMMRAISKGVNCICLVSDDTDFKPELLMAKQRSLHTVVVGDLKILNAYADTYFSWTEVASGRAEQRAKVINRQGMGEIGYPSGYILSTEGDVGRTGEPVGAPDLEDEPLGLPELDDDTDSATTSDDEERGFLQSDKATDVIDLNFDSFSDDWSDWQEWSESESESESEPKFLLAGPIQRRLQGSLTNSTLGSVRMVPTFSRGFGTRRDAVNKILSSNQTSSRIEDGANVHDSSLQKPQRLHKLFTVLENPFLDGVAEKKNSDASSDESLSKHFTRVHNILKPTQSEEGHEQRSKQPRREVQSQLINGGQDGLKFGGSKNRDKQWPKHVEEAQNQQTSGRQDGVWFEGSENSGEQRSKRFHQEAHYEPIRKVQDVIRPNSSEKSRRSEACRGEQDVSVSASAIKDGFEVASKYKTDVTTGSNESNLISESSDSETDEEMPPRRRTKGNMRTRGYIRKTGLRKRKVLKVVSEGPPPFYISGFADESTSSCEAINKYYADFWGDEEIFSTGKPVKRLK